MSWLLDPPFVLFETPIWIQVAVALPFWSVYFAVKGIGRWIERRSEKRWIEFLYSFGDRRTRDRVWLARFQPDAVTARERELYHYPGA